MVGPSRTAGSDVATKDLYNPYAEVNGTSDLSILPPGPIANPNSAMFILAAAAPTVVEVLVLCPRSLRSIHYAANARSGCDRRHEVCQHHRVLDFADIVSLSRLPRLLLRALGHQSSLGRMSGPSERTGYAVRYKCSEILHCVQRTS